MPTRFLESLFPLVRAGMEKASQCLILRGPLSQIRDVHNLAVRTYHYMTAALSQL